MSVKNYLEAIEHVLESEMEARDDLIVLRPGARPAFDEDERDVVLPRLGEEALSVALGAALYGMRPVLDMRQERDAAAILRATIDMLPSEGWSGMTIIANMDDRDAFEELSGARLFAPVTPRQAAGFTRAALRVGGIALLATDQTLYGMEDDVPEDDDFILFPLAAISDEEAEQTAAEEGAGYAEESEDKESESAGCAEESEEKESENVSCAEELEEKESENAGCAEESEEKESENVSCAEESEEKESENAGCTEESEEKESECLGCANAAGDELKLGMTAMRALPFDRKRMLETAEELGLPAEELIGICMKRAEQRYGAFEWMYDQEALPGECAYLPVKEAFVWIGCDMMTIWYDAERMPNRSAALLLRGIKRIMEKPTLLIYDKEMDER